MRQRERQTVRERRKIDKEIVTMRPKETDTEERERDTERDKDRDKIQIKIQRKRSAIERDTQTEK